MLLICCKWNISKVSEDTGKYFMDIHFYMEVIMQEYICW